jgi:hypothetical protein
MGWLLTKLARKKESQPIRKMEAGSDCEAARPRPCANVSNLRASVQVFTPSNVNTRNVGWGHRWQLEAVGGWSAGRLARDSWSRACPGLTSLERRVPLRVRTCPAQRGPPEDGQREGCCMCSVLGWPLVRTLHACLCVGVAVFYMVMSGRGRSTTSNISISKHKQGRSAIIRPDSRPIKGQSI